MAKKKKQNGTEFCCDSEWRAESDMRTLCEAEEIRRDKKRLAAAKAMAKEKLTELGSVANTEPKAEN